MAVTCPSCAKPAVLVLASEVMNGRQVEPQRRAWRCNGCGAWALCALGSRQPQTPLYSDDHRAMRRRLLKSIDLLGARERIGRAAAERWLLLELGFRPNFPRHEIDRDLGRLTRAVRLIEKRLGRAAAT